MSRFAFVLLATSALSGGALAAQPTSLLPRPPAAAEISAQKSSAPNILEAVRSSVAKPTSAWLVGPSQASSFDAKDHPDEQGCLMVAEFDNGMIVGIHARAAGIVGMTVDTKQQTLTPGQPATLGLNVGSDAYVLNAVATDNSTMAVSLDDAGGGKNFVERLTRLGNFRLLINQKPYYFATTGFTDGLARMQACMGSTMAVPVVVTGPNDVTGKITREQPIEVMKVTTSGNQTPLALAMPDLIPTGYRFVLDDVDPMTPISWQAGDDWVEVMRKALAPQGLKMSMKGNTIHITQRIGDTDPVVEDAQIDDEGTAIESKIATDIPGGVWAGAKGESLASVLEAWGLMAGVNVKVDLMGDLVLPKDVKYEGNFNDAVQKLLAQYNGKDRPVSMLAASGDAPLADAPAPMPAAPRKISSRTDTWKPRPPSELKALSKEWSPTKQMGTIPDPADAPKKVDANGKSADKKSASIKSGKSKWEALEGTSLRDVLEHWGESAGVKIVWMSYENYPLPKTIKEKGKFEDAVMKVLSEYEGQGTRPVAQLNRDPKTGEKALIIKTKRL